LSSDWLNAYRGQRVLVTGADSLAGRWVARALTQGEAEPWLVAQDAATLAAVCARFDIRGVQLSADLAREGAFARIYRDARPAVTFNLAQYGAELGQRDVARAEAINARLVEMMVEAVAQSKSSDWPGLRLVHAGSAHEYGEETITVNEDSPAQPTSDYGRTRLAGTETVGAACNGGLRAAAARLFTVYGPGEESHHLLPLLLHAARSGESVSMSDGLHRCDFLYVEDAAEGLLRLGVQRQSIALMNLATGRLTSVREFAETAVELLGLRESQLRFGARHRHEHEMEHGPADITRLKKTLFWKPIVTVREGIQRTIEFGA